VDSKPLISSFCHIIIFLFLGLTGAVFCQSTNPCTLTGTVTDTTGEPLHLVNVYLSGSTFGASTSRTGIYCMENIPGGSYQLIFQHIGYQIKVQNIQIEDDKIYEIDAQLPPKIYDSEAIQISATEPTEWRTQLNFFIKEFIGESQNADDCKILNPEVLNFHSDQETNNLIASTDSILRVINYALGYRLNIVLLDFRCKSDELIQYRIYLRFEILQANDDEQEQQWIENRQKTYHASFKHFLSTLARGKINEEYFRLSRGRFRYFVHSDSLKIIDMQSPLYKTFILDDHLRVSYSPERLYPASIIKFKQNYIVIDTLGNVLTPDLIEMTGEWYKHRVADLLPREYILTY